MQSYRSGSIQVLALLLTSCVALGSYLTSLSLHFVIPYMEIIIGPISQVVLKSKRDNVPGTQ